MPKKTSYSQLRKLSVADMAEMIRKYLRKLGGNKFEDLCEINSTNGFWFIWFPSSKQLGSRTFWNKHEWLLDWEGIAMRRYHLSAFFHRIDNPKNYKGE